MTESSRLITPTTSRRGFLQTSSMLATGAAALGTLSMARSAHAAGSDILKVGLIGCGGRGTGAAMNALNADPNAQLVALADAFPDRLESSLKNLKEQTAESHSSQLKVTPEKCFVGFDAYKQLIDSDVDVVLLCTPTYFRPEQLKYAIDKNKHVFCEKPVAVDAPGVRSVLASCEEAKKKNLNVVSGLCYRYHLPKRETYKRIHGGEIGDVRAVYTTYYTGPLWHHGRKDGWTDMEWQVRNWIYFNWLSGDHIAEQHIHSLDKASWALKDETPLACVGSGGRQVRIEPKFGDVFDHFNVMYEYASGPMVFAGCRQMAGCFNDVNDIVIGTTGKADIQRNLINKKSTWRNKDNPNPNMYDQEHAELFAAIRSGEAINNGQYMANSTLMAIMGRMSAYTGQRITWEKAMNSDVKLGPEVVELGAAPPVVLPVPGINTSV